MQAINKIMNAISSKGAKPQKKKAVAPKTKTKQKKEDYFTLAKSWGDDMYTETIASRNRYKIAFYWAAGLATALVLCVMMLVPVQHTELVVVHHYNDGAVWVEPTHQKYAPVNKAQVESEIVRYVINRESYSPTAYATQYSLVTLLSSDKVANEYADSQNSDNKSSPINLLGNKGYRKIHVDNVVFLDNKTAKKKPTDKRAHVNLAQISFTITDYYNVSGAKKSVPLTALISWEYRGTPKNPEDMWRNWDGFTVTRFTISQRNV